MAASIFDLINGGYVSIFNRAADPAGANFWLQQFAPRPGSAIATEADALALGAAFYTAPNGQIAFDQLYPAGEPIADFINSVYRHLGGSDADAGGLSFWSSKLTATSTQAQKAAVAADIAWALQNPFDHTGLTPEQIDAANQRAATYANRIAVSEALVTGTTSAAFTPSAVGDAVYNAELALIQNIDSTDASRTTALAAVSAAIAANNPALLATGAPVETFHLTIGVDAGPAFTAHNKGAVFDATPGSNPPLGVTNTLNVGDNLQDTALDGTLNYTAAASPFLANVPFATAVTLNGISTANITNTAGAKAGFTGNVTGLTTAHVTAGSNGAVQLGTAGQGLNTALQNANLDASQNFTAWVAAAALAGDSDAVNVSIKNPFGTDAAAKFVRVVNDAGTGNGYETVNISADSATFLQLGVAADAVQSTKTVTLGGAGKIELSAGTGAEYSNVTSIDASGNSGGVTITGAFTGGQAGNAGFLTTNTALTSFKGGSGADLLDISNMTLAQVGAFTALDGGDARDTLIVNGGINFNSTPLPDTKFEILQVTKGLTGTVNWTNLGANVDTLQLVGNAAGNVTLNNVVNDATLAFGTFSNGKSYTVNGPTGTADVLHVTDAGAPVTDFNNVTINGFETVNWTFTAQPSPPVIISGNFAINPSPGGGAIWNLVDNSAAGPGTDFRVDGTTNVTSNGLINISGPGTGNVIFDGAVTAHQIDAHTFSGHLIMGQPGATGPITILGTNQSDTLVGSLFADLITSNGGGDTITTGGGKDTVNLATDGLTDTINIWGFTGTGPLGDGSSIVNNADSAHTGFWGATAAGFTQIWGAPGTLMGNVSVAGNTNGTSADMVTINNFTMGAGAGHDVIQLDVNNGAGQISAWQHTFAFLNPLGGQSQGVINGGTFFIPAGDANIFFSSPGAVMNALSSVVELQGNYADANAVAQQIHTLQHFSLSSTIANTSDVHLIIAYQDQTGSTRIADLNLVNNSGAATADTANMNVFVSDLVQLVGQPINTLTNQDIHFV